MSGHSSHASIAVLLAAAGVCLYGCNRGMSDIDIATQKLVRSRSDSVGGGAVPPERSFNSELGPNQKQWTAKETPTTNPGASELKYDIASESRDVASRLDSYQKTEGKPKPGQQAMPLTLTEALRVGQRSSSEYLAAEEAYILAAIQLLVARHQWSPRLFNDTTIGLSGQGTDGDYQHALRVVNNLRVTKQLPYGGQVEAAWLTQATEQLREQTTGRYTQSSQIALSGNIPLLRGAGDIAQESLIQAERNLIYQARSFEFFRREFLIAIAADYFDLLQSKAEIANQEESYKNFLNIEKGQRARLEAGRVAEYEVNIAANNTLSATASLAGQKEAFLLQVERFKIRLGLKSDQPVELNESVLEIPDPEVSMDRAVELALTYRLDLQNQRDQVDDSRRALANAKNQTLPDLNLNGAVGIPTDPRDGTGGLRFSPDDVNYAAGITLGLPLDRQNERLAVRSASISLQARERDYAKTRDEIAVGVRQAVRNVDLARFQLTLADKQVEINQRRIKETELKSDEVTTQTRVDAANALQLSQNARDRARTNLRNTILRYLRDSGQLRIARDGTFQPLPGMERTPEPAPPAAGGN